METKCETCDHNNDHNRNLKKRSGDALEEDDIFPNSVHEPHVDPGLTAGVPGNNTSTVNGKGRGKCKTI